MLNNIKQYFFRLNTFFWTFYATQKVRTYGQGLRVNYRCVFTKNTVVGEDCHFNGLEIIGGGNVIIGDHFHSGSSILILTQNHNYNRPTALPYDHNDILRHVTIGKNCWIGSRAIILPGTIIEDGVVVQAGAVLSGVIPKGSVVGGNPWRILKYRDLDIYQDLENRGIYV